ncbi:MAG: hypothetical protein KBF12_00335 [Sebaldella sp.]|nr:hypothetical protein [Sebaldella sp.]
MENSKKERNIRNANEVVENVSYLVVFHEKRKFSLKDGTWQEKGLTYPSIIDLDLDTYLYLIDKEKLQ